MKEEELYRVFVGGLASTVQEDELKEKFRSFGDVSNVSLIHRKDKEGTILKTFGHLNIKTTLQQLNKCFAVFGGTKWKGHALKVQLAKDDFIERLRKEWKSPEPLKTGKKRKAVEPIKKYEEFVKKCSSVRKAIPGTPIEGENNWVIGKYGRPLPIVSINKRKKLIKHDPSKHCHCIKKINDGDNENDISLDLLTWELEPADNTTVPFKPKKKSTKHQETNDHDSIINGCTSEEKATKQTMKKKKRKKTEIDDDERGYNGSLATMNGETVLENDYARAENDIDISLQCTSMDQKRNDSCSTDNITCEHNQSKQSAETVTLKNEVACLPTPIFTPEATKILRRSIVDQLKCNESIQRFNTTPVTKLESNTTDNDSDSDSCKNVNMFDFEWDISSVKKPDFLNEVELREVEERNNQSNSSDSDTDISLKEDSNTEFNAFGFSFDIDKKKNWNFLENVELRYVNESENDGNESESNPMDSSVSGESSNETEEEKKGNRNKVKKAEIEGTMKAERIAHTNTTNEDLSNSGPTPRNTEKSIRKIDSESLNRKHEISEEMRKKSLETRIQRSLQCKGLIQNALKGNQSLNQKITFGDDDGDDEDEKNEKKFKRDDNTFDVEKEKLKSGSVALCGDDYSKDVKKSIFDSETEEESEADESRDEKRFEVKPQFQGEQGKNLFKMQLKFGDERFRLDERFAEDADDENGNNTESLNEQKQQKDDDKATNQICNDEDLEEEKRTNLTILESVIGKTLKKQKNDKNNDGTDPFERYDPTRAEHSRFEIQKEEITGKKKRKKDDNLLQTDDEQAEETKNKIEGQNDEPPKVSSDRFYEVDNSLKSLFTKNEGKDTPIFSFLGNNSAHVSTVEEEQVNEQAIKQLNWSKALSEQRDPVDDDVGQDDEVNTDEKEDSTQNSKERHVFNLFVSSDDSRITRGEEFKRTEDLETITAQWEHLKRSLYDDFKKKHKDAVRRAQKLKEKRFTVKTAKK